MAPRPRIGLPLSVDPIFGEQAMSDLVYKTLKYFFRTLALTPRVKALRLISEFQPMRSTDFDNLKQQNSLDSSCKEALSFGMLCGRALRSQFICGIKLKQVYVLMRE
jgi:hypothetical protein